MLEENIRIWGHVMAKSSVVAIYEVEPGKTQDFIGVLREANAWTKSKGGGDMRVYASIFAGENSGRIITVSEQESMAGIGSTGDAIMEDWGNSPIIKAISAGTMTLVSRSVLVDMSSVLD